MEKAFTENWILVTNDKDLGEKVFRDRKAHRGIIFLRLENNRAQIKLDVLRQLLESHGERIVDQFIVASERQVRFAQAPGSN